MNHIRKEKLNIQSNIISPLFKFFNFVKNNSAFRATILFKCNIIVTIFEINFKKWFALIDIYYRPR